MRGGAGGAGGAGDSTFAFTTRVAMFGVTTNASASFGSADSAARTGLRCRVSVANPVPAPLCVTTVTAVSGRAPLQL